MIPLHPENHQPDCPVYTDADLRAVLLGNVPEAEANAIADHIETCSLCFDLMENLITQTNPPKATSTLPAILNDTRVDQFVSSLNVSPPIVEKFERGDYIGHYLVVSEIGRGGSSIVYECIDHMLGRRVAVKVLSHYSFDKARLLRHEREARILAQLDHPAIVRAFEIEPSRFPHYIVMELVAGGPATSLLKDGSLPPRLAARLLAGVSRALDHAHRNHILHRDIKPSNLLLSEPSDRQSILSSNVFLKITDFDLARSMSDDSSLTQSGHIVGTPAYMSPEQARGHHNELGPASDIYSLGVVLYEFLTGRPPLIADNPMDTLRQITEIEPVSVRAIQPAISRDLETICMKCLRKDPADRYRSAAELADDLERFLDGKPILARPIGWLNRCYRWSRRKPGLAASIATSLVLMFLLTSLFFRFVIVQSELRLEAEQNADLYRKAAQLAERNADLYRKAAQQSRNEGDFSRNLFISSFQNLETYVRQLENAKSLNDLPEIAQKGRSLNKNILGQYILRAKTDVEPNPESLEKLFRDGMAFNELGYMNEANEIFQSILNDIRNTQTSNPDYPLLRRLGIQCVTVMALMLRTNGDQKAAADLIQKLSNDLHIDFQNMQIPYLELKYQTVLLLNLIDALRFSGQTQAANQLLPIYQKSNALCIKKEKESLPGQPPQ